MKPIALFQLTVLALCAPVALAQQSHPTVFAEPSGSLTLARALQLALERNPELAVFAHEIRAADARMLQARALPNPEAGVEVENFAGSRNFKGTRSADTTLQLSQLIELGGKRQKRQAEAALGGEVAALDYEAKRLEVLGAVAQEFIAVLNAQQRLVGAEEALTLTEKFAPAAQKRVEAGAASQVELVRFNLQITTARLERDAAARDLAAARKRLAALWGGAPQFESVAGDLEKMPVAPSSEKSGEQIGQSPALKRWELELERRNAAVALEQANAKPDVTVSAGWRHLHETSDNAAVVGVSIPLPLFNRNQGRVQRARAEADKAKAEKRATETRLATELRVAFDNLSAAQRQIKTLKGEILPLAQDAFDKVNQGYQAGRFNYLEVVDAQNTLIGAKAKYIEVLTAFQQAVAAIEALTGQPLEKLFSEK